MPVIDEQVDYGVDAMVQIFADVGNWLSTERLGLAKNYLECAVGIRLNFNIVADISGIPCPVLIFIRPNNFWHLQSLVNTPLRDIYAEVVRRETLTHCENIEVFVHDIGFVECSDHVSLPTVICFKTADFINCILSSFADRVVVENSVEIIAVVSAGKRDIACASAVEKDQVNGEMVKSAAQVMHEITQHARDEVGQRVIMLYSKWIESFGRLFIENNFIWVRGQKLADLDIKIKSMDVGTFQLRQ